jgi:serine/threonine protein phosphatase PrpC
MLDTIVAKDLYNETGVGCDNMTCVVIVFKKGNVKETEKRKETEKGNEKEKEKEKEK